MAIEVHCENGDILTKGWGKYQVGIFGFIGGESNESNADKSYIGGTPIAWTSVGCGVGLVGGGGAWGCLGVETSSCAGEIQASYRGPDTDRFFKSILSELLFGNANVSMGAGIRNDNPIVVEHVHSINSAARERKLNGCL